MRTRPIGVASALIAVVALVAATGSASSRTPGTTGPVDPGAFRPVVLDRAADGATISTPIPDSLLTSMGALTSYEVLRDPGTPGDAPTRPRAEQPAAHAGVVVKVPPATWHTAAYSWYGPGFYGSGTACGETYTKTILGVANLTLPCGTRVTLRNPKNGRTITVRVIDRGPYVTGRMWDLSKGTCTYLGNCYTSTIQYRIR